MKNIDRFLKYVSFDTQSSEESNTYPTTSKQLELAKFLANELKELGMDEVELDEYGIVYAKLKGNTDKGYKIGFLAHMDTSPDASGANIKPRIIKDYDGKDIDLGTRIMDVKTFPSLLRHIGSDLVVTDGTTLLGADDKAGITIIMGFVENIIKNNLKHNDIYVSFTPDEEVGKGTDNFNPAKFPVDFCYTIDGGESEVIAYENFNASSALVTITGKSVHPGSAKNKMVNASTVAMEFARMLDPRMTPENTEGYEGFNHLHQMDGSCEEAHLAYILRNHDDKILNKQKGDFFRIAEYLNSKYGYEICKVEIEDSYKNMYEILKDHMESVDLASEALKEVIGKVEKEAIRGGTDGARLTYMGLNCPNLGDGGYNFHGPYEYLSINEMDKMVDVLVKLNELNIK